MRPTFILFLLFISSMPGQANLLERFGASPKASGRAKAGAAIVSGWGATWANPAGLTAPLPQAKSKTKPSALRLKDSVQIKSAHEVKQNPPVTQKDIAGNYKRVNSLGMRPSVKSFYHEVGVGLLYQAPNMNIDSSSNSTTAERFANDATRDLDYAILQVGLAIDLREFIWTPYDVPVRLGFIAGLNADGTVSRVPTLGEERYQFRRLGNSVNVLSAGLGLAIQPWQERLSIGFSPGSASTINGSAQVKDISLDKNDPVDLNLAADITSKPAPMVGLQYRQPIPIGNLYFGFTYRMLRQSPSTFEVETELPLGFENTSETEGNVTLSPNVFILAGAFEYKSLLFMTDVEIQTWSQVENNPARSYDSPYNYNDIAILRFGVEAPLYNHLLKSVLLKKLALTTRFGYELEPSIVNVAQNEANRLDSTKHLFAFGLSRTFTPGPVVKASQRIDFYFSLQTWAEQNVQKNSDTLFDDGTTQPSYRYSGFVWQTGISYTIVI